MSEQLRRVIYVSEKVGSSEQDVADIVKVSTQNNPSKDITGCLVEGKNSFLQILEGPSDAIKGLYKTISEDKRHTNVNSCLLYTSPSPRDAHESRMPSSA